MLRATLAKSTVIRGAIGMLLTLCVYFLASAVSVASPQIAGSWETSERRDGLLFTPAGDLAFFNYEHRSPTSWSKYVLRGDQVEATDVRTHQERSLRLTSASELRDTSTGYEYHRVSTIVFRASPTHC